MNPLVALRRMLGNSDSSAQRLLEIREGIANMAEDVNRRLAQMTAQKADETQRNEQLLRELGKQIADLGDAIRHTGRGSRDASRLGDDR